MASYNHYLARKMKAGEPLSPEETTAVVNVLRGVIKRASKTTAGAVFGDILDESGMSQSAFATVVGVSQPYVSALANGERRFSSPTIQRFASAGNLHRHQVDRLTKAAASDAFKLDLLTPKRPERK